MASNSDRHHHRALNGHVDRRFAGSPSPGQGQGLLNTVDQNGPASNPFTGTSRRTGEMQHVVVLANSGERKEGATESTFEAIEKELDVVKDHLTMHMHRLKARLAEVKRQEQFQRTVSLDRGRRLNASSSSSSSPPPPSQWTVGPAGADGASDDGRRQSPQKFSQIEPKRMLQENEDATTAAVENRLLRQRIAQLMQREVALTLRADYLEHRLDVQTRIAAATRYRQIRKAATRESGLRKQTAAAIDDSNSHAADAETGIESCRGSIPEHLTTLHRLTAALRTRLSAKSVARVMFQRDALTYDELETIESEENSVQAADALLQIVMNESDSEVYKCFLTALKTTRQLDVHSLILNPDGGDVHGVDAGLEALIRKHYDFLLNHVDSRAAALIDRLYSEELIDLRLKNELEEERNAFLRNSRILSAASTTWSSREQFDRFLSVLDQTGQGYIADVVRGTPKENSSSGGATIGASRRTGVDLIPLGGSANGANLPSCNHSGIRRPDDNKEMKTVKAAKGKVEISKENDVDAPISRRLATTMLTSTRGDYRLTYRSSPVTDDEDDTARKHILRENNEVIYQNASFNRQLIGKFDAKPHCVTGIAHLDRRIYVIADLSDHVMVTEDSPPYALLQSIVVHGLQRPTDVAACHLMRRLFVADYEGRCVWPVDVDEGAAAGDDTDEEDRWEAASVASVELSDVIWTSFRPWSISVTSDRLVVVPENGSMLCIYRCRGGDGGNAIELLQSIRLPSFMIARHAVESPTDRGAYLVAHTGRGLWNELDQVSEINCKGQVVRVYGGRRGAGELQLDRPTHLALVDQTNGGGVLVADYRNRRIVRLTDRLVFNRIEVCVGEGDDEDCGPGRLCHAGLGDKLFVGFWSGGVRLYGPAVA